MSSQLHWWYIDATAGGGTGISVAVMIYYIWSLWKISPNMFVSCWYQLMSWKGNCFYKNLKPYNDSFPCVTSRIKWKRKRAKIATNCKKRQVAVIWYNHFCDFLVNTDFVAFCFFLFLPAHELHSSLIFSIFSSMAHKNSVGIILGTEESQGFGHRYILS